MIRILHIVTYMGRGGLETMLMNYYRNIDRSLVQFDFLVHRSFRADYDDEIESLGGKIFRMSRMNPFSVSYRKKLLKFFKEHPEYKIVHSHLDCMSGVPLSVAQKANIPIRIAHAHSSSQTKDIKYPLKLCFRRIIANHATQLFACSDAAGKWMFLGNPYSVIHNAIDLEAYSFNREVREKVRNELNIQEGSFVLGHVGRFMTPKNHFFIIDIFSELNKQSPNTLLLLVGDGELKEKVIEYSQKKGCYGKISFLGMRTDVNRILQAMDLFLFPSLYEGLPLSLVEAQAAGLPCVISDKVPLESKVTDNVSILSLNDSAEKWVDRILQAKQLERTDTSDQMKDYSIKECAQQLVDYYLNVYKSIEDKELSGI